MSLGTGQPGGVKAHFFCLCYTRGHDSVDGTGDRQHSYP